MERKPIEIGEWYHIYNRGVDKRVVFEDHWEFERFQGLLYRCNTTEVARLRDWQGSTLTEIYSGRDGEQLVEVGAVALMSNHFHLLVKEVLPGGVSKFMQKLITSYTMYFNKKYMRSGPLFAGRYKSKHVADDRYFKRVVNYIHANPAEMVEPEWKRGVIRDARGVADFLTTFPYSSFKDYTSECRAESAIVSMTAVRQLYEDISAMSVSQVLADAQLFAPEEE